MENEKLRKEDVNLRPGELSRKLESLEQKKGTTNEKINHWKTDKVLY